MAVALDAVGTAQTGTGTSASIPITIGAIVNGAVRVDVTLTSDTVGLGATIGGETIPIITGTDGGATTATAQLGKSTALTGAQTVVVSWTNSQPFLVNALSFSGVDPLLPFNNGTFGTGASPKSLTITSASGDLTGTVCVSTGTPSTNQTSEWTAVNTVHSAGDIGPGTGTTTHTWTSTTALYISGCNIVAAGQIRFVNGGHGVTPVGTHASTLDTTIPATVAGNDLIVTITSGDDPTAPASVTDVTGKNAGATVTVALTLRGAVTNNHVRTETWGARNIPASLVTVTVNWGNATVGVVNVGEYANAKAIGLVVTASGASGTAATIALTTQDANNWVAAGLGDEGTAQSTFSAAAPGVLRSHDFATGDGIPDVNGALIDNQSAAPASVACTVSTPATAQGWAAVAVELRTVASAAFIGGSW